MKKKKKGVFKPQKTWIEEVPLGTKTGVPHSSQARDLQVHVHGTLGAEIENPSTDMSVEPSPAADIVPPDAPPPPALMVRLKAVSPALDLASWADFAASFSSNFL